MADTAPTIIKEGSTDSRLIRVFLSSTFRDFMEERDLLVKQVFPELRRKARERGVDVVDVDLRWGITEEESRQGKVIPICLGEIDRCRPYFVGMLGERYGWIPPASQFSPEVIERQPWLTQHLGGVSVTELEILHGVLNDPAMAGRAFFYFRDPAWSTSQSEPGFVCETAEEEAKLTDLKQRIHTSGFPVTKNLPDPKALADQIARDLWELIEQQYPNLNEADALEREERQHASYRRSRLGIYLGGKRSINQLERWIDAGQQKILITGESGAGKSALISNWIEVHRQHHPEDVVFAHHLGCSNDASAIRPLLARLIDTAKKQLPEAYGYSLSVPQDWWELVAKAVEALQSFGRWAQQNNHRWIWVLDGLDRLDPDDQKALPWLPLTIPEGVVIMASALECPAREILLERKCKTRTIAPLTAKEQDALIKQYLGRYTKQLIAELRQTILSHPLARSPLFLRVLLEELRQCGRYETLAEQLTGYLSAETIDDLYERVLERLEADGNGENVRKVLTALWASRAGLSEEELLSITGLKPLQWAPIDLALEEALGRNGNRLVFDHDYLRKAVEDRYLPTEEGRRQAHSELADWFAGEKEWDQRKTEELPWQLINSKRYNEIQALFLSAHDLYKICSHVEDYEVLGYWHACSPPGSGELDKVISGSIMHEIQNWNSSTNSLISFVDRIGHFLYEAGYTRELLIRLREISVELEDKREPKDPKKALVSKANLGNLYGSLGMYDKSISLLNECSEESIGIFGKSSLYSIQCLRSLFSAYRGKEDLVNAEIVCNQLLLVAREAYPEAHPEVTRCKLCLAGLRFSNEDFDDAHSIYIDALESAILFYGHGSREVLDIENNLVSTLWAMNNNEQAKASIDRVVLALRAARDTTERYYYSLNLRGAIYYGDRDYAVAEACWLEALELYERTQDTDSPDKITMLNNLGTLYHQTKQYDNALSARRRQIKMAQRVLGKAHPDSLNAGINFAHLLSEAGELTRSIRMLQSQRKVFEAHKHTESRLYQRCLRLIGLNSREMGDYRLSEESLRAALLIASSLKPYDHDGISAIMAGIAKTLDLAGQSQESLEWRIKCLAYREENIGYDSLPTNRARYDLASALYKSSFIEESILQLDKIESSMMIENRLDSDEQKLIDQVADLRFAILGT